MQGCMPHSEVRARRYFSIRLFNTRLNIILNISPDDIFRPTPDARALMQQRALAITMRKHGNTAHNRLDGISIQHALLDTREEERRLASLEIIV